MNSSNDLKSGQKKLSMQMLMVIAIIILVAAVGLVSMKFSSGGGSGSGSKSGQVSVKILKDVFFIQTNLYKIQSMVASNQDKKEIEKISDQQTALINEDINQVKKVLDSDISSEQKKFFQGIMGNLTEYQKSAVRFMKLAPAGTGTAYLSAANEKMEAVSGLLMELSALEGKPGEVVSGSSGVVFPAILVALALLMLISVFMIPVFIKNMINNHVVDPIQEAASVLRDFSAGKFSKQLSWEADDAIGELVQTVNVLRTKMNAPVVSAPTPAPAAKTQLPEAEPAAKSAPKPRADESSKTLSGMVKKAPDHESLVLSSKKAIDKLQDI